VPPARAPRLVVLDAVGPAFVEALQRAWDDGDAVLPLDPRLPAAALDAVLTAAEPDRPVEAGDALVVATSGTDGLPKAVVLTHDAVAASASATSARLAIEPEADVWLACLPLSHVGGLSVVTRALHTGTRLVVHERFDAAAVEAAVAQGCTRTSLVPTALARVDPAPWRTILVGGQAAPPDRPGNVVATYGMTETGSGIAYDGVPLDEVEVRVADDGELHVRGPMLLRAYRDGTDPKDASGWFPTGDLGALHDGVLEVHGRRGDLIISGGENVWPTAVERALVTHAGVREVAVVGRPDPEWGQVVVAVVVPEDPTAPPGLEALRAWAKVSLPAYAAPRALELVATLPRTALGKVRRRDLTPG
jgi:o-succinylbenzoate---CoA ligase